jgi:hypothetical protein
MGFWGTYIVTRADKPLPELPALRAAAESAVWHGRGPAAPGAAPLAVTWAAEAGLQPNPAAVAAALEAGTVFCSEAFFDLLSALGIPDLADEVTSAG